MRLLVLSVLLGMTALCLANDQPVYQRGDWKKYVPDEVQHYLPGNDDDDDDRGNGHDNIGFNNGERNTGYGNGNRNIGDNNGNDNGGDGNGNNNIGSNNGNNNGRGNIGGSSGHGNGNDNVNIRFPFAPNGYRGRFRLPSLMKFGNYYGPRLRRRDYEVGPQCTESYVTKRVVVDSWCKVYLKYNVILTVCPTGTAFAEDKCECMPAEDVERHTCKSLYH